MNRAASYPGPMPKHEDNVYRAMRAMLCLSIGGRDGQDRRRPLETLLRSHGAGLVRRSDDRPQYSPQRAAEMQSIRADVLKRQPICRQEFGKMPSWAPDLPLADLLRTIRT